MSLQPNTLKELDFTQGIKAAPINYNFDLIEEWIRRERLRIGGHGIVEGFDLTDNLPTFSINVGEGIYIGKEGYEMLVNQETIYVGEPKYFPITEIVTVDPDGRISLKYTPYSPSGLGLIFYNPPEDDSYPIKEELFIKETNTESTVPILASMENIIYVNIENWAGKTVTVSYHYCDDRIDAILLDGETGEYIYEKSVLSTSPSHIDYLQKYQGRYYLIGFAHWIIGRTITVEFITIDRTYRKVYVDKYNRLFLNGKLYKDVQIVHFTKPEKPEINDLWYDYKTNCLYIWREQDGHSSWTLINDLSNVLMKEIKFWYPDNFPEDKQTFLFEEDEMNLCYQPGVNSLDIVIANVPLMQDQFEEIVVTDEIDYMSRGIGFKLKDPLDHEDVVQCIVHQNVRNGILQNIFQRAAIFTNENYVIFSKENNSNKFFTTDIAYTVGEEQLEVFVDGKRLRRNIEFVEMKDSMNDASEGDRGNLSQNYRIIIELDENAVVTYKITKHIWNYDQVDLHMKNIEAKADEANDRCTELESQVGNLSVNMNSQINELRQKIIALEEKANEIDNCIKKTDTILMNQLDSLVIASLKQSIISEFFEIDNEIIVPNCNENDFISIIYLDHNSQALRTLIPGTDYGKAIIDSGTVITFSPELIISGFKVLVSGISFRKG